MAKVYSTRFLVGNPSGVGAASYLVPAGRVAIVSNVDVIASANGTQVLLTTNGLPWWSWFCHLLAPDTLASGTWEGRAVLNAGETLGLTWSGLTGYQASGWLLSV